MGFRIPSTEIHSAIALKVVGFYDNAGTNVVIIPEEVMVIHGADLDVDSLFIIVRENFDKDYLINGNTYGKGKSLGYDATGAKAFEQLDSDIAAELDSGVSEERKRELEDIQIKLASNIIMETFLEVVTYLPNRERMTSPISKEDFVSNELEDSGRTVLESRGLVN